MLEYIDALQERFFTWCDNAVQAYIDREGAKLKQWWPRKNPEGNYELVFKLVSRGKPPIKHCVAIPKEYHELLEREYFIDHPWDEEEEKE